MLVQFNFGNYRSYKDEVSISLETTKITGLEENIINIEGQDKLLKSAAIYGTNASGKTNIIKAFEKMRDIVMYSVIFDKEHGYINLEPFALDAKSKGEPTLFEVFIKFNGEEYQYGFKYFDRNVVEEWLNKRSQSEKKLVYDELFYRHGSKVEFKNNDHKELFDSLMENSDDLMNESRLILSVFGRVIGVKEYKDVLNWFKNAEVLNYGELLEEASIYIEDKNKLFSTEKEKQSLLNFLNNMNIDICDFEIRQTASGDNPKYTTDVKRKNDITGEIETFSIFDESSGTLKLISMFQKIHNVFEKRSIIFIDELDAKLHPYLSRYIIKLFNNEDNNCAQLIYTTHDTTTLKNDILRRDQIWFVEVDENKSSQVYSLAEFITDDNKKVRKDASYDKDYLKGQYGAVPNLKEMSIISTGGDSCGK
ncbi:MAG: ATP-binding protein [Tissierellales bacterium]|jgi:AAA15 family ATPase/GTPase|nr:ATP-binding protein [Tissierellales bacterium]